MAKGNVYLDVKRRKRMKLIEPFFCNESEQGE